MKDANEPNPLNHDTDTDGDGLRDGQELAGWVVGIWYERTMEKKENRSATSNPWVGQTDTDSDGISDFSEFMNGSDPRNGDTDGDGILDADEIARKSNITGIEGTPPQISNVHLDVGIDWDWWGFLYLPLRSHVTVSFDVTDDVGVGRVDVKFIRSSGTESVHLEWSKADAPTSYHFAHRFDFSIAEALIAGADVNITAFDVNENGAWGDFHVKSVLEAIADAIAAFLSAIAKVIAEALSAAFNWIWSAIRVLFDAIAAPLVGFLKSVSEGILNSIRSIAGPMFAGALSGNSGNRSDPYTPPWASILVGALVGALGGILSMLGMIIVVFKVIDIISLAPRVLIIILEQILVKFAKDLVVGMIMGAIMGAITTALFDQILNGQFGGDALAAGDQTGGELKTVAFEVGLLAIDIVGIIYYFWSRIQKTAGIAFKEVFGYNAKALLGELFAITMSMLTSLWIITDAVGAIGMALVDILAFFVALKTFIEWREGKAEKSPSFGETDSGFLKSVEEIATIVGLIGTVLGFVRDAYSLFTWSPSGEVTPGLAGRGLTILYITTLGLLLPLLLVSGKARGALMGALP